MSKTILTISLLMLLSTLAVAQTLTVTQTGPSPSYVVAATSSLTIQVVNIGGAAAGGATISEAVPAGMNLMGVSGTNWTCSSSTASDPVGAITCTYSAAIAASGGSSSPLTLSLQPRRSIQSTSPTNNVSVDPSGGAAPPAASTCTGLNTPDAGCGTPLASAVPAASSNVHMGPQGDTGNKILNNMITSLEHYDTRTWPQPDFATLSGNIVVVSPKTIKNTGNIPWSFGLIQGNKNTDSADSTSFAWTGGSGGIFFDNAPDIISEVSFDNGATWVQLKSAAGLSSTTTHLTRNIHTLDPANVPFGGYVLQPGQSLNFLVRHTWPNARYAGRKELTINIYVGLYMPGTPNSLFLEGFVNLTSARTWVAPNGVTGTWSGNGPTNEIFESTQDTIITGSIHTTKAQSVSNSTGVGAATEVVSGAVITYTITITAQLPNTTPNPSLTSGPWARIERFPVQSSAVSLIEDGSTAPNNWASWTDAVPGSASCSIPATIIGDTAGSSSYTFNLTNPITAGNSVTCTFQRSVK